MSEVDNNQEGEVIPEGDSYSPEEQKAMAKGWRGQEEWQGDPEEWVDAKEFNRRGELMGKITSQNRKINDLNKAIKSMHEMMVKNNEQAYQQALEQLSSQREQALTDGDTEQVRALESKAKEVYSGLEKVRSENNKPIINETPEYFETWMEENPWYNTDDDKTAYANAIANQFVSKAQAKGQTPDRQKLLEEISTKVNKMFNKSTNNSGSMDVLGSSNHSRGSSGGSMRGKGIASLRYDEQQIARTIMQSTGMTEAEYMKSYNATK